MFGRPSMDGETLTYILN